VYTWECRPIYNQPCVANLADLLENAEARAGTALRAGYLIRGGIFTRPEMRPNGRTPLVA